MNILGSTFGVSQQMSKCWPDVINLFIKHIYTAHNIAIKRVLQLFCNIVKISDSE